MTMTQLTQKFLETKLPFDSRRFEELCKKEICYILVVSVSCDAETKSGSLSVSVCTEGVFLFIEFVCDTCYLRLRSLSMIISPLDYLCALPVISVFLITLNQKRLSKLWDKYADNKKQKSSLSDFRVELVSPDSGERKKERLSLNFDLLSFLSLLFPTTTFLEHSFLPLH